MFRYTLRQIEYFVAAAETGSLSAAAAVHHVSQAGVSTAISQLEKSLDAELAIRHKGRGFQLTPAGEEFLEEARFLLQQARELEALGKGQGKELAGRVLIGCDSLLSPFVIPPLVDAVAGHHPRLQLVLREGLPHALQAELLTGKLDLLFINRRHMEPGIVGQLVQPAEPYVIFPPGHPLTVRGSITFRDLRAVPLILLDTPSVRNRLIPSMRAAGIEPDIRWGSESLETVRSLVARGHGVAVLMQRPAVNTTYDGLTVVPKPLAEELEDGVGVYIAHSAKQHLPHRLERIIHFCVNAFRDQRSPPPMPIMRTANCGLGSIPLPWTAIR